MDSFCFPAAPCPSRKPFLEPSVPDASLLMNIPQTNSYQAWRNNSNEADHTKKVTSILKKQVRFNSSSVSPSQQVPVNPNMVHQNENKMNPTQMNSSNINTPPLNKVLKNRPFQEIYMANIPNRHLDLSLIDLNKQSNATGSDIINAVHEVENEKYINKAQTPLKTTPTTYKEFLEMQKNSEKQNQNHEINHNITDILNYSSPRIEQKRRQSNEGKKSKVISENSELVQKKIEDNHDVPDITEKFSNLYTNRNANGQENISSNRRILEMNQRVDSRSYSGYHEREVIKSIMQQVKVTCENSVQTSMINPIENDRKQIENAVDQKNDEPTVKDLLKIIQQQNEQLLVLQKQVASLLDFKDKQKCIEPNKQQVNEENELMKSVQHRTDYLNSAGSTPRKGHLPKFSIDLMTSFEVSFRPQQNIYQRKQRDLGNQEPKIQEIVEVESEGTNVDSRRVADPSLFLQEPITVRENCPSPEPSINIDMKDYESSDEDNEDTTTSDIGASFYQKMMDQVNKIIQNAQRQSAFSGSEEIRERTLSKVRDATIKQLKKINMNFSPIEEVPSSNCSDISDDTTEQINSAVKQLLMKYLPDDQLSKLHTENNIAGMNRKRSTDKIVLNSRAPQFSFATVQFMKKYDLISNEGNDVPKRPDIREKTKPTGVYKMQQNNPKILDISRLRQQPKLL